jgi:uncharacterized repeat protein (TIGR03943 family)
MVTKAWSVMRVIRPWLDSAAALAWGIALLRLWVLGQLTLLIHPNYVPLTVITGLFLCVVGGLEGFRVWRQQQRSRPRAVNPAKEHISLLLPVWSSGILLWAAILALVIAPRPFTSDKAIHRGVTDSLTTTRINPASFRTSNRPEERTLIEWIRTLSAYPEPDAYTGQKAKISGFVVHDSNLPDNVFLLTRFVITCCAADVYPVSLPVMLKQSRSNYPPDRWLQVEGTMVTETLQNKRQLAVSATNITPIPEPKNPYES